METKFDSKNYVIIKVRNYADEKLLKKHFQEPGNESKPLPKQHYYRAKEHFAFFHLLVEKVTGKNFKTWADEYLFDTHECLKDEIRENYGILIIDGEGWVTYFLPKEKIELIGWFIVTVKLPLKIVKKTRYSFFINNWLYNKDVKTNRIKSRELTKKFKDETFNAN